MTDNTIVCTPPLPEVRKALWNAGFECTFEECPAQGRSCRRLQPTRPPLAPPATHVPGEMREGGRETGRAGGRDMRKAPRGWLVGRYLHRKFGRDDGGEDQDAAQDQLVLRPLPLAQPLPSERQVSLAARPGNCHRLCLAVWQHGHAPALAFCFLFREGLSRPSRVLGGCGFLTGGGMRGRHAHGVQGGTTSRTLPRVWGCCAGRLVGREVAGLRGAVATSTHSPAHRHPETHPRGFRPGILLAGEVGWQGGGARDLFHDMPRGGNCEEEEEEKQRQHLLRVRQNLPPSTLPLFRSHMYGSRASGWREMEARARRRGRGRGSNRLLRILDHPYQLALRG